MSSTPSQPGPGLPPDFDTRLPEDIDVRRCYRHPDRETGVSCSNCGRPICHECMIPAPVGFRCPECVRQQNAGRAKVVTRSQMRSRWSSGLMGTGRGEVTRALVIINVVVFLLQIVLGATALMGGSSTGRLLDMGALVPVLVAQQHEYWRLVTTMFLHYNFIHILFNMWALWVVGAYLEALVGRLRFLLIYFVSGLAGSAFVLVLAPPISVTVGASGAVFGLFAALGLYSYVYRGRDRMAAALFRNMAFIIVLNLVFSVVARGVSWQGHVGGLIGGAAVMAAMLFTGTGEPRGRWSTDTLAAIGVIAAVIFALIVWRTQTMVV
jgi:membrane associated rhomboid family serine protease